MTVGDVLAQSRRQVATKNKPVSMLDAELLLAKILGKSRCWLFARPELSISRAQESAFKDLWRRRCLGEPLAYILQSKEFFSLDFLVTPDVLIPRPDSELLVETILALDLPQCARVLEVGTGSGALVAALAKEKKEWSFVASDVSTKALQVAEENLRLYGLLDRVELVESSWFDAIEPQEFDLVFSNPPYIALNDSELDSASKHYEPPLALFAGVDGLDSYRQIFSEIGSYCRHEGRPTVIALEHGHSQSEAILELLQSSGLMLLQQCKDLAGHPRVVVCSTSPR